MPSLNFPSKRLAHILAVVFLLLFGTIAAYAYHEHYALSPGSTPAPTGMSNVGMLPDIPAPAGWSVERIDSSRIVLTHRDADAPFHSGATIDVEAFKGKTSVADEIKSLAEDHTFDSAKTWDSLNGRLILAAPFQEGSHTSILTYTIWSPSQIYVFNFSPYQTYDPVTQAWIIRDPADLPVMKKMVEEFAVHAE
jgi:hypothetical protein